MYGAAKIASWKAARRTVFDNDETLMKLFETDAMVEAVWLDRLDIGKDWILGLSRDDMEVEPVSVYRLSARQ
jgi:hypothetical protein